MSESVDVVTKDEESAMSSGVPESWEATTLNEVAKIEMGQSPPSETYNLHGEGLPFFQGKAEFGELYPTPEKYCSSPKKTANEGCILVSVRAPVGPTNLAPQKCCIGRGLAAIEPVNGVDTKFLLYFFRSIEPVLSTEGTGSTFSAISGGYLRQIRINVPSYETQRLIVAKLEELFSELDNSVANLKAARAQLKTYRQSLLQHAFEGRLTEQWRRHRADEVESAEDLLERVGEERETRHHRNIEEWKSDLVTWEANGKVGRKPRKPAASKAVASLSEEDLPEIPPSWTWVRLGSLIEGKPTNGLYKPASDYGEGIEIIRIDDFYEGVIRLKGNFRKVAVGCDEAESYRLEAGDILVNRVNSIEYLGKVGLVLERHEGMLFESNMMRIRTLPSAGPVGYLVRYLSSQGGATRLTENAKHAVNQASINQSDVLHTPVPLPPVDEQQVILKEVEQRLSAMKYLEEIIEESKRNTETMRQSILKQAFEGRLLARYQAEVGTGERFATV